MPADAREIELRDAAYDDGRVAAEAVRVLEEVKDRLYFLAVGFWRPHAQFNALKRCWDLYDRANLPNLDSRRPEGSPDVAFHANTQVIGPIAKQKKPTPEQSAEMRPGYFANISDVDAQLETVWMLWTNAVWPIAR